MAEENQSFTAKAWKQVFHGFLRDHEAIMLLIDIETGKILEANRAAEKFYGRDAGQLYRMTLADVALCGPELTAKMESVLQGSEKKLVCSHKTAANQTRVVEAYPAVVEIEGRRLLFVILHDVTAYKEAQEKYSSLFNRTMDGVYRSTHDGKLVDINPAMVKMFGYDSEGEMKSVDVKTSLYFDPEERGSHILDTGKEETEIYRMKRKDGSEIWVEDRGWYVHDERGEIIYHEGILRDVTERKRAQNLWNQYTERLQILYQASRKLSASLGKQHIYETACESIRQLIACDVIHISSFDRRTNLITLAYGFHDGAAVNAQNYPPIPLQPEGKGIQSETIRSGKPQLIRDYQARLKNAGVVYHFDEQGRRVESPLAEGEIPRSALIAPMTVENQVIGVIETLSYQADAYAENDLQLLNALASQVAVALINSDLFQQLQQENRERRQAENSLRARTRALETLFAISSYISWGGFLESEADLLPKIFAELKHAVEADALAALLLEADEKTLRVAGAAGLLERSLNQKISQEESAFKIVYKSRQPYQTEDLSSDALRIRSLRASASLGAAIFTPILGGERLLGVLLTARKRGAPAFTEEAARLIFTTGELLGNAINRMRLHAETLRQLECLKTLRAVDQVIASSLDLRITLNILLKHVVAQLGVDAASIFLLHPHLQTLQFAAGQGFRTRLIERAEVRLNDQFAGRCAMERAKVEISDPTEIKSNLPFARLWLEEGFAQYICVPLVAKGEVKGVLETYRRSTFTPDREWYDFLETLAGQAAISIDNGQMFDNLQNANTELMVAYDATIEGWSRALDLRDQETEGHTQRVANLTLRLAKAMGVPDREALHIRRGALLHDIGKMGVPDSILLKKGPLTPQEWKVMRQHPTFAFKMLQPIRYLKPALDIPYCHHEKWNGGGYPRGLKGEEIPLAARIFSAVDVYDALTSSRRYRRAWSKKKALAYIKERSGVDFDPMVVEAFLRMMSQMEK